MLGNDTDPDWHDLDADPDRIRIWQNDADSSRFGSGSTTLVISTYIFSFYAVWGTNH